MVFPLGIVPVTLAVSVIWLGRNSALATKAWAVARPDEPPDEDEAVVPLPDEVVAVDDDFELLLQAASSTATTTTAPRAASVRRCPRLGGVDSPECFFTGPPPQCLGCVGRHFQRPTRPDGQG
jgi:hypothetical protein